jgi:type I restriction enzyme S subunit
LANSSARLLPKGSVIFTRDATIGLTAITGGEMAVSQHLIAWIPGEHLEAVYLLRVFDAMRKYLDKFTFGATIKTIGMDDVRSLYTPLPPKDEQLAIAEHVSRQIKKLAELRLKVGSAIELLTKYRSALITNAVTGKIDVRGEMLEEAAA